MLVGSLLSSGIQSRILTPLRKAGLQLFVASFVVLFQELALIRWYATQVRVLAYFPNVILISAFLGLGLGCLLAGKRSLIWLWPVSLLLVTAAGVFASRIAFTQESVSEHLWLLYFELPKDAMVVHGIRLPIILTFVLTALSFVALGQFIADRLRAFRNESSSLWGYAADLLGSLTGVITFAAFSMLGAFPIVWFCVLVAAGSLVFARGLRTILLFLACSVAILVLVQRAEQADMYSPYYAVRAITSPESALILTNGSWHQLATTVRRSDRPYAETHALLMRGYHLPYRALGRAPRKALIMGAGTGNDVAVALDEGAKEIDAVEIDPVILQLGKKFHPNRPYSSAKVHAVNADGRSFLNSSTEKYDLIVFGTLDSLTRLSALSNVRLDNFIYTLETFEAVKRHLTSDGGFVLYFRVWPSFIDVRLAAMLTRVFGTLPVVITTDYSSFNRIYLIGPAFQHLRKGSIDPATLQSISESGEMPTDDWPYLYLAGRSISSFYLSLIAAFALISVAAVFLLSPELRNSVRSGTVDWEMFLFGAAFLLLETKSVTEMNLVWGATWLTNAVVFGAILFVVLVATVLMQLKALPWWLSSSGLVVALLMNYAAPVQRMAATNTVTKLAVSVLFVGAPIFFAATCFAILFKDREAVGAAFGWNLLGAVAGGLLEFTSMMVGLKNMALIALVAYLLAFLIARRSGSAEQSPATLQ